MKLLMNHKAILSQASDDYWIIKSFISLTMQVYLFFKFPAVLRISLYTPSSSKWEICLDTGRTKFKTNRDIGTKAQKDTGSTLEEQLLGTSSVQQQCKTDWENNIKTGLGGAVWSLGNEKYFGGDF